MTTQSNSFYKTEINLAQETIQILKTVLLLERHYSAGYLARILVGDTRFDLRKPVHKEVETFGSLDNHSTLRIEDIIYYVIDQGLLGIEHPQYGTIELIDKGREWLGDPQDMYVNRKEVYTGWWGFELRMAIRSIRKDIAENTGKQPYEFFSNHSINQMVRALPLEEAELNKIHGMKDLEQATKLLILAAINQVAEKKAEDDDSGVYSKAYSPSHRKVKDLYESGFSVEEIAQRRKLQTGTVLQYLFNLQKAGAVDLYPWIEEQVDAKELYKGTEYFRSVDDRRLKAAHKVLGMSYDTLALCRHYAEKASEPALKYAS